MSDNSRVRQELWGLIGAEGIHPLLAIVLVKLLRTAPIEHLDQMINFMSPRCLLLGAVDSVLLISTLG